MFLSFLLNVLCVFYPPLLKYNVKYDFFFFFFRAQWPLFAFSGDTATLDFVRFASIQQKNVVCFSRIPHFPFDLKRIKSNTKLRMELFAATYSSYTSTSRLFFNIFFLLAGEKISKRLKSIKEKKKGRPSFVQFQQQFFS